MLHGAQNPGLTASGIRPAIVVLTSSNTSITFEFVDYASGSVLNPTATTLSIDFIVAAQSL
jgi:hypothetical protein